MKTLKNLYALHDQEMKALMEDQQLSWHVLNERYGKGNIPPDVYQQWDEQHGNTRLHSLRAQHEAELEAYPLDPREYAYQQEKQKQQAPVPAPDVFEQLKQKQQPAQDVTAVTPDESQGDIFAELKRKQREQGVNGPGDDNR